MKRLLAIAMGAALAANMGFANQPGTKVIIPVNRTSATSGKQMYTSYCAPCHGVDAAATEPTPLRSRASLPI